MTTNDRLIVAVSGGAGDAALVAYARMLAERHRDLSRAVSARRLPLRESAATDGAVTVDEADDLVLSAPQATEYVDASVGPVVERLMACAADPGTAAVLVGEGLGRRAVRALVRRAASSVWFVPENAVSDVRRILVPTDFSVRAADSLRAATTLACLTGASECLALHVGFDASPFATAERDRRRYAELAERYARFMAPIDTLDVPVTPLFRECPPVAAATLRVAEEQSADLIVLASRGRTRAAALLFESVADQVLRDARVPVLVLKHFGAQLGLFRTLRDPALRRRNELYCN